MSPLVETTLALAFSLATAGSATPSLKVNSAAGERKSLIAKSTAGSIESVSPRFSWEMYLRRLSLPPSRVKQVHEVWEVLERFAGSRYPFAALSPSGEEFSMIWDRGRHHFEVDLLDDGTYDWFYMDRNSDERASGEGLPVGIYPPEMFSYMERTLRERWTS